MSILEREEWNINVEIETHRHPSSRSPRSLQWISRPPSRRYPRGSALTHSQSTLFPPPALPETQEPECNHGEGLMW